MLINTLQLICIAFSDSATMEFIKIREILDKNSVLLGNGCRLWFGGHSNFAKKADHSPTLYGRLRHAGKVFLVHRLAMMVAMGTDQLPPNQVVSHLCHNGLCINEEHIILESQGLNNHRKTCHSTKHCTNAHHPPCLAHLALGM